MSPKRPVFTPVVLIPRDDQTPLDKTVIDRVHAVYEFVKLTMDTARSRQKKIGPSEFGDPCRKCLARKLAQVDGPDEGTNWKAQIGTFGHSGLEQHFLDHFGWMYDVEYHENPDAPGGWERKITVKKGLVATDEQPLYHLERRVIVGTFGQRQTVLDGSCDLFIQGATYGIVCDWKFQGKSTLAKSASGKIGPTYHTQMNGYGCGYARLGFNVTHVLLFALPRDDEIEAARPVLMRFEPKMAEDALTRLGELVDAADVMQSLGLGWDEIIAAQPSGVGCWDCRKFEQAEQRDFVAAL